MKLTVRGHGVKVTKAMKEYAQKKFIKLESFFDKITEIIVELEVKSMKKDTQHVAKVNILLPKHVVLHGETKTKDMYSGIDQLVDKMAKPIKKYQDRYKDKHKARGFFSKIKRRVTDNYVELLPTLKVSKEKKASLKPMDPVEAVLQLSKTNKNFYVFNNSKTHHSVSIVYDRKNGTYGLQTDKKMYIKRAKLKGFKDMPADKKYKGKGVKITKIKDLKSSEMTPHEAAAKLSDKFTKDFMSFTNVITKSVNVVYKKKNDEIGWIEPVM